jgi:hypothetical protein
MQLFQAIPILCILTCFLDAGLSAAQRPDVRMVRNISIAGDTPDYFLNRVSSIAIGKDSSLYVLMPSEAVVLQFDERGRFLRKWGRSGSGPGEMRRPAVLGWRGDSLWVFDFALARISLFTANGAFHRAIAVPVSGTAFIEDDGGIAVVPAMTYSMNRGSGPPIVVRKYTERGKLVDTLVNIPPIYRVMQYERAGATTVGKQPFEDGPILVGASNGSGFLIVRRNTDNQSYRVVRVGAAGDTVVSVTIPYSPRPQTSALVDKAVNDLLAQGPPSQEPGLRSRIEEALYKPRHVPAVSDALIGQDSTLWLRREMMWMSEIWWSVLQPDGRKLFDTILPTNFRPFLATRHEIWGVMPGENDVPMVVSFRVSK